MLQSNWPGSTVCREPAPAGLYGAEETARGSSQPTTKGTKAGIRRAGRAASGGTGGLHHRVRDHRELVDCDREWITLTGQVKQRPCNSSGSGNPMDPKCPKETHTYLSSDQQKVVAQSLLG
jgi:hypothetical protein